MVYGIDLKSIGRKPLWVRVPPRAHPDFAQCKQNSMKEFSLKIGPDKTGSRLDKFLRENFPQFSRHWLQKLIKEGLVLLNAQQTEPSAILKNQDIVNIVLKAPAEASLEPDSKVRFEVIYENDDVAIISKPAGLVVHPSETVKNKTLVNGLLARWPEIEGVGEDSLRPGLVHRLDKETSGLLIIAKNSRSYAWLKNQFQKRLVIKRYLALVHGVVKKDNGIIEAPIMRSPSQAVKQTIGGEKGAITFYVVKKRYKGFTLVEVQPKTGRRHQIRVHFAYIGHSVVGDEKYTPRSLKNRLQTRVIRHFLHAYYLELDLPNGEHKIFEIPLPKSMDDVLKSLK